MKQRARVGAPLYVGNQDRSLSSVQATSRPEREMGSLGVHVTGRRKALFPHLATPKGWISGSSAADRRSALTVVELELYTLVVGLRLHDLRALPQIRALRARLATLRAGRIPAFKLPS